MTITLGLDVGGAHLKVARVQNGSVAAVAQVLCPLWTGFDRLAAALIEAAPLIINADRVAVTMTGELSDLFANRREGVERLVTHLTHTFGPETRFFAAPGTFLTAETAIRESLAVGSMNFLATACYIAEIRPDALLCDMGSTTTDIVPIVNGRAMPLGLTDAERLTSGSLIYTGLTRTALMAVATEAPFRGRPQGLCRELFATMADVYRILNVLPEGLDLHATADGRGKSVPESMARLARMFGRDVDDGTEADWRRAAAFFVAQQIRSIEDGCDRVLSALPMPVSPIYVLAGIGTPVLQDFVIRCHQPYETFGTLTGATGVLAEQATHSAPAVAVALLLERHRMNV